MELSRAAPGDCVRIVSDVSDTSVAFAAVGTGSRVVFSAPVYVGVIV